MAENLTQNQIITIAGRKKMLRARAGEIQLPKIVGFVFGDGGVDADGNVIAPLEAESELKNELLRKKYDTYTMLENTSDSITNICLDSGFESQRTFNRVFKERYKISPSDYRSTCVKDMQS